MPLYQASDASSFVRGQLLSPNGGVAMHYWAATTHY